MSSLSQWLQTWLTLRSGDLRPRTIESYEDLIHRYIDPSIGSADVNNLDPVEISIMLASIVAKGHSRTAELVFVMLKAALKDFEPSPMKRVKRPSHIQQTPDPWSPAQMHAYFAALPSQPQALGLMLGLLLGLRRGEICGLRWCDVDFAEQRITICNQRQRMANGSIVDCPPKSRSSVRTLPIPPELLPILKARRQLSGYLCPISPSGLDAAHRRLVHQLQLPPIPLHGLRHSMATACIRNGGSMRSLQALLGHSSYTTTANRYTHPDMEMLRSALDCATKSCYTVIRS